MPPYPPLQSNMTYDQQAFEAGLEYPPTIDFKNFTTAPPVVPTVDTYIPSTTSNPYLDPYLLSPTTITSDEDVLAGAGRLRRVKTSDVPWPDLTHNVSTATQRRLEEDVYVVRDHFVGEGRRIGYDKDTVYEEVEEGRMVPPVSKTPTTTTTGRA